LSNQAMLLKMFLEQAFGSGVPSGKSLQILERDFAGLSGFSELWLSEGTKEGVEWLVLALSFSDFRFHLFPLGEGCTIPFGISPMMCACLQPEIIRRSNLTR